MIDIMLDEYFHKSAIPDIFGETYLETKALYRDYYSEEIVGESVIMVLDLKTETGIFETKPDEVIDKFNMHHSNGFNNFVKPYEHFWSFLSEINYEERMDLHRKRIAFISHVRVFNEFKGKGYGKEIMDSLNRFCKRENIDVVFLKPSAYGEIFENETLKVEANERLYRFYKKAGFTEYPYGGKHHLFLDHQTYMYLLVDEDSISIELKEIECVQSEDTPSHTIKENECEDFYLHDLPF